MKAVQATAKKQLEEQRKPLLICAHCTIIVTANRQVLMVVRNGQ